MNELLKPSEIYRGFTKAQVTSAIEASGMRAVAFRPAKEGETLLSRFDLTLVVAEYDDPPIAPRIILK